MRYVLAVKQPNYGAQGAFLAYQTAQALLARGHQIEQIFFFQNGVNNANKLVNPASDEVDLVKNWVELAKKQQIPLHLCIAAAQRRGVVNEDTSPSTQSNLAEGFHLAGLGEFSQAVFNADRLLTF